MNYTTGGRAAAGLVSAERAPAAARWPPRLRVTPRPGDSPNALVSAIVAPGARLLANAGE
eukprot:scaffold2140_cov394-Prasinococcus_capsulatus_cf.AAC.23